MMIQNGRADLLTFRSVDLPAPLNENVRLEQMMDIHQENLQQFLNSTFDVALDVKTKRSPTTFAIIFGEENTQNVLFQ